MTMIQSKASLNGFSSLGLPSIPSSTEACIEEFVCTLYIQRMLKDVNAARFVIFVQNYAPKRREEPLEKIKGINPSSMPPCRSVLQKKIQRANYVTAMWKNATLSEPTCNMSPEDS